LKPVSIFLPAKPQAKNKDLFFFFCIPKQTNKQYNRLLLFVVV
jgi:hypothetical protein